MGAWWADGLMGEERSDPCLAYALREAPVHSWLPADRLRG